MKFHLQAPGTIVVTALDEDSIRIGNTDYREGIVLTPDAVTPGWAPNGFAALAEADFAQLLTYDPELVLLGTGPKQQFPHPRLLAALAQRRVGVESMDSRAACRTFNILVAEGRRVVAAVALI
jgi:uncharacterized protein